MFRPLTAADIDCALPMMAQLYARNSDFNAMARKS